MSSESFILRLPTELCEMLVADYLPREDIKSMRRTCKFFNEIAKPALFYGRIVLSRVKKDRDAFEEVAEDYGRHVKEFVWQELDIESWQHDSNDRSTYWPPSRREAVTAAARDADLFWIPSTRDPNGDDDDILRPNQPWVADWLSRGIGKMPNIATITIQPTSRRRKFKHKEYEFSAWEFLYQKKREYRNRQIRLSGRSDNQIALPSPVGRRHKARTLNVTTNMQRMDLWNILGHVGLQDREALRHLTTINICAFEGFTNDFVGGDAFPHCLQGAENLRNLRLCFPIDRSGRGHPPPLALAVDDFPHRLFADTNWPHLHSLHLVNAPSFLGKICDGGGSLFVGMGPQLRHLTLENSSVEPRQIYGLRTFPHLESITIRSGGFVTRRRYHKKEVSEDRLLAFLRHEIEDLGLDLPHLAPHELITDTEEPHCELCVRFVPEPNSIFTQIL
ncbi:hypothetical protein F5B21DRAFT_474045 [Xylaria acuta]|nr:hypothetical protein F5B21DRAFT_474045 [Xylaria acuta]